MGYAELHCLSNFSFLRGASHPEELCLQAAQLGYEALALTDECSVAGVVRAHRAIQDHNLPLKLIIGSEFRLPEAGTLILLCPNREAYGQLCRLITRGRRRAEKGHYNLSLDDFSQGLELCLLLWKPAPPGSNLASDKDNQTGFNPALEAEQTGLRLQQWFPQRLWIAQERLLENGEPHYFAWLKQLAQRLGLPRVACGDVHMHLPERQPLQDVLTAILLGCRVQDAGMALFANRERHLRPLAKLQRLYDPELLAQTLAIARRCTFSLTELRYEYPKDLVPADYSAADYLHRLLDDGIKMRYPQGAPAPVLAQVHKELALIAELQYEHYFLTIWDIVRFARAQGILCQGRGSAANSAVCYCLGITEVDPARLNLLFERFISRERREPPDIDVDFEHQRREEVIQYLYAKYGRERAALTATVISYRPRSALRDVGRALGLDAQRLDLMARSHQWWDGGGVKPGRLAEVGFDPGSPVVQHWMRMVNTLVGFPRHLSQHTGGFVIARDRLDRLVPIENAAMADRSVIQWDKDDLDALGLLKVDVLALGMLSAIRRALELITERRTGNREGR